MELTARRYKIWNPKTHRSETRPVRALYLWRFAAWVHTSVAPVWRLEIRVKDSPQTILLNRHGLLRQNHDWSYHWHVCLRLGRVNISYDGNAHRRQGWEMRSWFAW